MNTINNSIIPARIREARVSRALSMAELADKIGVTSQAISQYELGNINPSMSVVMKLVRELNFPISFFRKQYLYEKNEYVSTITYFRSNKNIPKKVKDAFKKRFIWINEIYCFVKQYVNIPKVNLPNYSSYINDEEIGYDVIEDIALDLRKKWGLDKSPISNMVTLLQNKGIVISRMEFKNKKVDAFSRFYLKVPYIFLGSDKKCAVRSRFDLAHELGHLILHNRITEDDLKNRYVQNRIEDEANYFAGAFLLPSDSFMKEIVSSSIDQFILLKGRWKVSIQAMIKRCENLNILTDNQIRYLKSQMTKYKYWRKEPLDDELEPETPYLFKQIFEVLIKNGILTPESIIENIGLNKEEIDSLCCLPDDILSVNNRILPITLKN
jgi:Zn-dependent peptidase ImmA (M78 family)/DNA-binding XRE family transcriptional regulator